MIIAFSCFQSPRLGQWLFKMLQIPDVEKGHTCTENAHNPWRHDLPSLLPPIASLLSDLIDNMQFEAREKRPGDFS